MIFLAAGTQKFPMDRLFEQMDALAAAGKAEGGLFAQIGCARYEPAHYPYARFLSREDFDAQMAACDLLITHGGVATIIAGLKAGKPVIVMPRLAAHGEHVDDHQRQIAEAFEAQNLVSVWREGDDPAALIAHARAHEYAAYRSGRRAAEETIREFLAGMTPRRR